MASQHARVSISALLSSLAGSWHTHMDLVDHLLPCSAPHLIVLISAEGVVETGPDSGSARQMDKGRDICKKLNNAYDHIYMMDTKYYIKTILILPKSDPGQLQKN